MCFFVTLDTSYDTFNRLASMFTFGQNYNANENEQAIKKTDFYLKIILIAQHLNPIAFQSVILQSHNHTYSRSFLPISGE